MRNRVNPLGGIGGILNFFIILYIRVCVSTVLVLCYLFVRFCVSALVITVIIHRKHAKFSVFALCYFLC